MMKLDKICRACLVQKNDLKQLFEACIPNMIMTISSVQIVQGDGLPHQICTQCLRDVNRAFCFKQKCEKSDSTLRSYFQNQLNNDINEICQISREVATDQDIFPETNLLNNCTDTELINTCQVLTNSNGLIPSNIENTINLIPESTAISTSMSVLSDTIAASITSLENTALGCDGFSDIGKSLMNNVEGRNDFFGNGEVFQENPLFGDIFSNPDLVETFQNNQASAVVSDLAETMQNLQTIAEQYLPESWENENSICPINADSNSNNFGLIDNLSKCQFCGDLFKDTWMLEEHTKSQVCQDKYFSTNITNELTKSMLLEYTFDTSSSYNFISENVGPSSENLLCNICDRTFTDRKYLKKHLKDIHFIDSVSGLEEKKIMCTLCGKRYKSYKALDVHMRTHTGQRPLKCDLCSCTFALPSSLHKHKQVHKERQYECNICGRRFKQQSHVNVHMLVHSNEKRHVCLTCGKRFSTNSNLEIHTRIHTGVKPFVCTFCEKGFITSTQMKKHVMVHTGEKPYSCWICGQSFRRKETRDTHVRYHTRDRIFGCKICDKKYISKSHLRDHIKATHTDKPPKKVEYCMICGKEFQSAKALKTHICLHTGQKQFACSFCNKCYVNRKALNTHLKRSHTRE